MRKKHNIPEEPIPAADKYPVHTVTIGQIRCSVWNDGTENQPVYTTQILKRYFKDNAWKTTHVLYLADMIVAKECLTLAIQWINQYTPVKVKQIKEVVQEQEF